MRKEEYLKSLTSNNNFDSESFTKSEIPEYNINFSLPEALCFTIMIYGMFHWFEANCISSLSSLNLYRLICRNKQRSQFDAK
jgi:hypothetical protein